MAKDDVSLAPRLSRQLAAPQGPGKLLPERVKIKLKTGFPLRKAFGNVPLPSASVKMPSGSNKLSLQLFSC